MNAKILLMVIAIFGTSLVFSQTVNPESKTKCEKKVLRQIKRSMNSIDVADYMEVNHKIYVVLTCKINEEKIVEVVSAEGFDESLNAAVIKNLESKPVKCESQAVGSQFSLLLTFKRLEY